MYMRRILALLSVFVGLAAMASAPSSDSEMLGNRICLMHLYEWSEGPTGVVVLTAADPFYAGGWTTNVAAGDQAGRLILEDGITLHGVSLPIMVDYATGTVTIQAGNEPFAVVTGTSTTTVGATTTRVDSTMSYYVVDEAWVMNQSQHIGDVTGTIQEDGSVYIAGGMAYYIEVERTITVSNHAGTHEYTDSRIEMSRLMREIRLLRPNGKHEYVNQADGSASSVDVYIRQSGDTVYVTNLYGMGWSEDYMLLSEDGVMTFPSQPIADISDSENPAGDGMWYNNTLSGNATTEEITWGQTTPTDHATTWPGWNNNRLYFTDGSTFVLSQDSMRGDVNGDGSVTIGDVTALIDYLLTNDPTGVVIANTDCNLDQSITIGDVTALIDYLLTGSWGE